MEQKTCKKCGRPLPDKYKHKKCENCRNLDAKKFKDAGKAILGVAVMIGGAAISIATNGKFNLPKKK